MRKSLSFLAAGLSALAALAAACGGSDVPVEHLDEPFTSDVATLLDFDFDGTLTSTSNSNLSGQIHAQMLYMVGHINGEPGVAHLDKLALTNLSSSYVGGGLYKIKYHLHLPVAWGSKTNLPSSYQITLPSRADSAGQNTFTTKYSATCNDGEGAAISVSNFWYHYRPKASGCTLAPADVVTMTATVTLDTSNTVSKYPEYHKIWEDGALNVVAIFAKYEAGATSPYDAGIAAYNQFYASMRAELPTAIVTPAAATDSPGVTYPDITFTQVRADGTIVNVTMLLINVMTATPASFDRRYAELVAGADLISYDGHAGLGANIAALTHKGKFMPGKYQIFFMNGCDTYAYIDTTLATVRKALNPDDPSGTRYMDLVTNAMPAYFNSMPYASMAFIHALLQYPSGEPTSYGDIFHHIDQAQVVVVTGEEDNVFTPEYDPGPLWNGLDAKGAVGKSQTVTYVTDVLQPGHYVFTTNADPAHPGGDADLRVRIGAPPTITSTYKCPSYSGNSNERCPITIATPSRVYIAVTGDATGVQSPYYLRAFQLD